MAPGGRWNPLSVGVRPGHALEVPPLRCDRYRSGFGRPSSRPHQARRRWPLPPVDTRADGGDQGVHGEDGRCQRRGDFQAQRGASEPSSSAQGVPAQGVEGSGARGVRQSCPCLPQGPRTRPRARPRPGPRPFLARRSTRHLVGEGMAERTPPALAPRLLAGSTSRPSAGRTGSPHLPVSAPSRPATTLRSATGRSCAHHRPPEKRLWRDGSESPEGCDETVITKAATA